MQKKLADYFRHLVDQGDEVLSEFYEPRALLRSEEAAIVTGLLLGLNIVDCNLCVKVIQSWWLQNQHLYCTNLIEKPIFDAHWTKSGPKGIKSGLNVIITWLKTGQKLAQKFKNVWVFSICLFWHHLKGPNSIKTSLCWSTTKTISPVRSLIYCIWFRKRTWKVNKVSLIFRFIYEAVKRPAMEAPPTWPRKWPMRLQRPQLAPISRLSLTRKTTSKNSTGTSSEWLFPFSV